MKRKTTIAVTILVSVAIGFIVFFVRQRWQAEAPQRAAAEYAHLFVQRLASTDSAGVGLRDMVAMPAVYRQRTTQEQDDFIRKALKDEISGDGLRVLVQSGEFGSLREMFPAEAEAWTKPHGINPGECVAFRASRDSLQAELVLHVTQSGYRIIRCNNVRQLGLQ